MENMLGHLAARRTPSDGRSASAAASPPVFDSGTAPAVIIEQRAPGREHPRQASMVGRMRSRDGTTLADAAAASSDAAGPSKPAPARRAVAGKPPQNSFKSNDAQLIFGQGARPTLGPKAPPPQPPPPKASTRPRPKPKPSAAARRSPEPAVASSPLEELVASAPANYKPRTPSPILTDDDEAPASKASAAAGPSSQRSPRRARKSVICIPERGGAPHSSLEEAAEQRRRDEAHMDEGRRMADQLSIDIGIWKSQESSGPLTRHAVLPLRAEELVRCPWCDGALPDEPSSELLSMLQQLLNYTHEHPGHKISATKTVSACHRHHDELVTIPEGKAKGWPTQLEVTELEARAEALLPSMETRVLDPPSSEWFLLCKQREEARRGAAHGIEAFSEMQPGYYGELGWITLRNVLTSRFLRAPSTSDLDLGQAGARTAPLGAQQFIDAVLLPEMLCLLIKQDRGCSLAQAKALKDESSAYGLAVFPATIEEHDGWGADDGVFGEAATQKGPFKRLSRTSRAAERDAMADSPPKKPRGAESEAAPSPPPPPAQRPKPRKAASANAQASASAADAQSQQNAPPRPRPRAKAAAVVELDEPAPGAPPSGQRRPRPRASNSSLDSRGASGSPTKRRMTVMDLDGQEPSPSPCSMPSSSRPLEPLPAAQAQPLPSQPDSVVCLGSQLPRGLETTPPPPASLSSLDASDAEPDPAPPAVRAAFLRGRRVSRGSDDDAASMHSSSSSLSDADASGEEDCEVDWSVPP